MALLLLQLVICLLMMNTQGSTNLNFYSKHNRAKQKKNITSLYSLLPSTTINGKSSQQICLKINLSKQNANTRRQQSYKTLNSKESMHSLQPFNWLHESQKQEILSHIQISRCQSSSYQMNATQSKMSQQNSDHFNHKAIRTLNEAYNTYKSSNQRFNAGKDNFGQQIQSFYEGQEEEDPYSVVIQRINISSNLVSSTNHKIIENYQEQNALDLLQSFQAKVQQVGPLPLAAQMECSQASSVHDPLIFQNIQQEHPDKFSHLKSQYGQEDFQKDVVNSPIQLIERENTQPPQSQPSPSLSPQLSCKNLESPITLQQMMRHLDSSNQIVIQKQPLVIDPSSSNTIDKNTDDSKPKIKKVNFKALMAKNKNSGNESEISEFPFKSQRNKKLLTNFFDQN